MINDGFVNENEEYNIWKCQLPLPDSITLLWITAKSSTAKSIAFIHELHFQFIFLSVSVTDTINVGLLFGRRWAYECPFVTEKCTIYTVHVQFNLLNAHGIHSRVWQKGKPNLICSLSNSKQNPLSFQSVSCPTRHTVPHIIDTRNIHVRATKCSKNQMIPNTHTLSLFFVRLFLCRRQWCGYNNYHFAIETFSPITDFDCDKSNK